MVPCEELASNSDDIVPCEEPPPSSDVIVPCGELTNSHSVLLNEMPPESAVTVNKPVSVLEGPSTSPLSNLLVCPALSTSSVPKRPSTCARLLTSDESLRLFEEKEKKKPWKKKRGRMKELQKRRKEKNY